MSTVYIIHSTRGKTGLTFFLGGALELPVTEELGPALLALVCSTLVGELPLMVSGDDSVCVCSEHRGCDGFVSTCRRALIHYRY